MICDYGCGQEAKHRFKNGKWCCSNHFRKCPSQRIKYNGKNNPMHGKKHTIETINKIKNIKANQDCSQITKKSYNTELKQKRKHRAFELWADNNFRKNITKLIKNSWKKQNVINKHKRTISKINKQYPFFSKIEEIRYNPDKPGEKEIQVHCKNHNCPNSKEQDGWFTPTGRQIETRISALENKGVDLNYFYCSNDCKDECPLYYSRGNDPFKEIIKPYTQEEYHIWRNLVLKQDDYECQKCGSKENLNCHHIIPVKVEPLFALDPDNGIVLCESCHYKYGHKTGTECSTWNLANKTCQKKTTPVALEG